MQKHYWRFFWPLSLTGLAMLLARQFQNGAVARYPDATHELAVYALATSVFGFFNACRLQLYLFTSLPPFIVDITLHI